MSTVVCGSGQDSLVGRFSPDFGFGKPEDIKYFGIVLQNRAYP